MNKQDKKYPKILTKKKCTIVEYKFIEILLSNINKEKCDKYNIQEVLVIIKKANQNNSQNIGENNTNTSGYRDYPMKLQQLQIINLVLSSEGKCIHMHKPYHRHTIKKAYTQLKRKTNI